MKRMARQALLRLGLDVARRGRRVTAFETSRRLVLATRGIDVVFDVGANEGQYARRLRELGYRGRIVSFEPHGAAFERLARAAELDPSWDVRRAAVGDEAGRAELHVGRASTTSSLLPVTGSFAQRAEFATVASERVDVVRLDDVTRDELDAGDRLLLKLDVQGLELAVLRASPETLARALAVETELALASMYEGDPHYLDVLRELEAAGLHLVAAQPGWVDEATGQGIYLDAVAARPL